MSNKHSTGKDKSDKTRNGEIYSGADSPLRDPPHSTKIHHTKPTKIRHERPLTSNNRHPQSEKPDNPRVKSSRPAHRDSAVQDPPSAAQNRRVKSSQDGRTSIDVEASDVEQRQKTDDEDSESTSPKCTNENKTKSPTTRPLSRPSQKEQGLGRRIGGSNEQPYVLESDLRRGSNYYLYCLGKIYDVSDMRRRKEMQYWNLLARQRQLGFHSAKECEVYMRYLSRPRTADIYSTPTHSSKSRTRSTEGRRGQGEEPGGRCGGASEGKGRTVVVNEEKDEKESSGDYKVKAARSKTRPITSEPRSVSSKARPVGSKTPERRPASTKTKLVNSKTSKPGSKTRLDSSKEVDKRAAHNQRSISRDEDEEDEEKKKKGSNETTDEENETSENDEDKTRNKHNSPRDKDKRGTKGEQKSSIALTSKAAEVEEETSDGNVSEGRSNTQRDGGNKPVDARNRDGRNTEVASSNEGGRDSGGR